MRIFMGLLLWLIPAASTATPSPDTIRSAAAKGLALIQTSQKNWYAKQSCFSCHQQILPALAIRAAHDHGIPVDRDIERTSAAKTFGVFSEFDKAAQYHHLIDPAISEGNLLVAAHAAGVAPSLTTAVYARHIAVRQQPDGHWATGDARPPQSYSNVTATAIALRAVQLYRHPSLAADAQTRANRAAQWLASRQPRSTEERAFQLYGLHWAGAAGTVAGKRARELRAAQHSDGGWAALDGRSSDAYSTGQALMALHDAAGVPISDSAWKRGIQFLIDAQAADGSWHVRTRLYPPAVLSPPYFETGYPYGHDQFISSMGAAWAVRALAAALGPAEKTSLPDIPQTSPKGLEPWVETALFGTPADLEKALAGGLDPNASTKSGGTTVLMLVQPDTEKTRLLLDRGANINARSKSKYSALLMASLYPDATPAIGLLLDRGAEMELPKGGGAPLYNASPVVLATFAGNAGGIPRLRKAGGTTDRKIMLLGIFPQTALATAVAFGDVPTTRALLDAGANANETDDDGFSVLYLAVVSHRPAISRLLIERGANVNVVDKRGMTPLLYAASADFGDASIVDLLLKSGANPGARTSGGATAFDLARKYKHDYLFASLHRAASR